MTYPTFGDMLSVNECCIPRLLSKLNAPESGCVALIVLLCRSRNSPEYVNAIISYHVSALDPAFLSADLKGNVCARSILISGSTVLVTPDVRF